MTVADQAFLRVVQGRFLRKSEREEPNGLAKAQALSVQQAHCWAKVSTAFTTLACMLDRLTHQHLILGSCLCRLQ